MKKLIAILILIGVGALGPVQAAISENNPFINIMTAANAPGATHVDATCQSQLDSTGDADCDIELRSPAELAAQADQG